MKSVMIRDGGLGRDASPAEAAAVIGGAVARVSNVTAGAALLVAGKDIFPGAILVRTGAGAGYSDTLPTGALMDAAFPEVPLGGSFKMTVASHVAFIETIVAGAQHTVVAGSLTAVAANASADVIFTRVTAGNWTYELI